MQGPSVWTEADQTTADRTLRALEEKHGAGRAAAMKDFHDRKSGNGHGYFRAGWPACLD
jgi:hypothetical protein